MASEKQIAANRANAKKSCGPQSAGGKGRASRNAIRHGLAANFRRDPSAVGSIELVAGLLREAGYAHVKARLAAEYEVETRAIIGVQSRLAAQLREAAEIGADDAFTEVLQQLQRVDRYERRVSSRKKRLFRQLKLELAE